MSLDTMEWIRGNLSSNSSFAVDSVNWDLQFGAILWSLWRRCNAMIFDPENLDMFDVSDRSIWLWKDMQSAYVLKGQDRPNHASRADSLQSSRGSLQSSRAVARWSFVFLLIPLLLLLLCFKLTVEPTAKLQFE
ncbi:hypothetical protein V6N11_009119 [Hibiscus sabdariffa]|uniref:Uncharacterized protein n=1 Tax=Hibiscus sabdariffa TaxID=183260 RepID=A0ABR2PPP4_9ROSI